IAVMTTFITLIMGLPLALWISRQTKFYKQLLLLVILFPILTNAIVRNFAWIIILGKNGIFNTILLKLHLINAPLTILYTDIAIILGSVYLFLPIMVTTLASSANSLDIEIEEAAAVLGANTWQILMRVIIPQLRVGILTGVILVFAGTMTAYTTPQLLGGNQHLVMSTLIYQQAMTLGNWSQASVVALVLVVLAVII
ncbi:ABC transporter permease, partial [Lactobacillus sp. XV13L]|nr:ABC transporter permease [Lactobacillus sp. XV13L]